jgi:RNA polymerase sigma factor (sigma-70 family)
MSADPSFVDLLGRVRAGDQWAAADLVRRYEPALRREVRRRLTDARLRRVLDGSDVCQLVLQSFFARAARGQFELDGPDQLQALLARMARNKLGDEAKKERRERRGGNLRRTPLPEDGARGEVRLAASEAGPAERAAAADLLRQALARFSPDERRLVELKAEGLPWPEVAARLGGSPEARRKQCQRAVERVARELQLDEVSEA